MENVADALRMAFAVLVFVIAMAIALGLLSQANATTTEIFHSMDKITYIEQVHTAEDEANHRIVGLETIIPTIYRYPVENCGVTIIDENGKIVARYDLETDTMAGNITTYNNGNKESETYKQAARSYLSHMEYLTKYLYKLDYGKLHGEEAPNGVTYEYSKALATDICKLYKYGFDGDVKDGAAWGPDTIAERLKSDFSGEGTEINNRIYNSDDPKYIDTKIKYGGENSLLSYLGGKQFKEYIIEVDTTYDIIDHTQDLGGETIDSILDVQSKNKKLEIMYVEQPSS